MIIGRILLALARFRAAWGDLDQDSPDLIWRWPGILPISPSVDSAGPISTNLRSPISTDLGHDSAGWRTECGVISIIFSDFIDPGRFRHHAIGILDLANLGSTLATVSWLRLCFQILAQLRQHLAECGLISAETAQV